MASRRHLELNEAELALKRGKLVEIFLGPCVSDERRGVRFAQLEKSASGLEVFLFEMALAPHIKAPDPYELFPLNPDHEGDEGEVWTATFADLKSALSEIQLRYPGSDYRLVNFGVVADEYADYLKLLGESE